MIERWNQTFKRMLFRLLKSKRRGDNGYLLELSGLVRHYNNKKHRALGMSPAAASEPSNYHAVVQKRLEEVGKLSLAGSRERRLAVGDLVRVVRDAQPFAKGYRDALSADLFTIAEVKTNLPVPMYKLRSQPPGKGGKMTIPHYYKDQLMPADAGAVRLPQHKIVSKRTVTVPHRPPLTARGAAQSASWREVKLKWTGLPPEFDVFMPESLYRRLLRQQRPLEEEEEEEQEEEVDGHDDDDDVINE